MEWYKMESHQWNYIYGLIWRIMWAIIIAGGLLFSSPDEPFITCKKSEAPEEVKP